MAVVENVRSNPQAVTAVRGVLGCDEETATDVVESVRPYLEAPLQKALMDAYRQIDALKAAASSA